jgi:hypothetical protein
VGLVALDAPAVNHDVQVARQETKSVAAQEALAGDEPVTALDNWEETAHHRHRHHNSSVASPATSASDPTITISTLNGAITVSTPGTPANLFIFNFTSGNISITQILFDNIFISIVVVNPSASPFV